MTHQEPDFEELGVMKDLLKSSMTIQEEGGTSVPVRAPTNGKIIEWRNGTGNEVSKDEPICYFKAEAEFVDRRTLRVLGIKDKSGLMWIHSPAEGALVVLVESGEVLAGMTIAVVFPKAHPIKPPILAE